MRRATEIDDEGLETLFDLLSPIGGPTLVHLEPAPGAPELTAVLRPAAFIELLREVEA